MAGLRSIGSMRSLGSVQPRPPAAPIANTVSGRPPANPGRTTTTPRGPEILHLGQKRPIGGGGPGEPPVFFTETATVSAVEWIVYWASAKLFNDPVDPRQPPYDGARLGTWSYQVPELPGAPRQVGGSVSDFVYFLGTGAVIVRLDTFYFHTAAPAAQQARDRYLALHAANPEITVRTLYDSQILGDPTGAAAVRALADVLAGREIVAPVRSGLAFAPRDEVFA